MKSTNSLSQLSHLVFKTTAVLSVSLLLAVSCRSDSSPSVEIDPSRYAQNPYGLGPAGISLSKDGGALVAGDLGSAGNYAIMAKTGISNVIGSTVTGHLGASPVTATSITGFALSADATNVFSTSPSVVGKVYAAQMAAPTTSNLTTAIGSMETAYTDAATRVRPNFLELEGGDLSGLTLVPGLYKWGTNVTIPSTFYISGSATDVWIFQIAGNITMASGMSVILQGGALPENIFWQVAGAVEIGTSSHFEGIILCKTAVDMRTNASLDGRILSQTFVALDDNIITQP